MFRHCRLAFVCRLVLAAIVAILVSPAAGFAQFDTASVLGTVRDSTGAVVPGATVTLKNVGTGITATTVSDENGDFQFLNVQDRLVHGARRAAGLFGRRSRRRPGDGQRAACASTWR